MVADVEPKRKTLIERLSRPCRSDLLVEDDDVVVSDVVLVLVEEAKQCDQK